MNFGITFGFRLTTLKQFAMKKLNIILIFLLPLFFTSCIVVDNTPGPNGRDGDAYFGVDFEHHAPYSYWDNNKSVPYNPILGEYYFTAPGIYDFEYFINPHDYYYGTYEVWINRGGVGGSNGQVGYNGNDNYLMLICDPNGFHEHRENWRVDNTLPRVIEKTEGTLNFKITIQKGSTLTRTANAPKYKAF